jgi:hypothetical protein
MVAAAKDSELQERLVVRKNKMVYESRMNNNAIKNRHDVQLLILLGKLSQVKLEEFDNYPLTAQKGFIHAIPEEDFDMATIMIIDATFLGVFPKKIYQVLRKYQQEIKQLMIWWIRILECL